MYIIYSTNTKIEMPEAEYDFSSESDDQVEIFNGNMMKVYDGKSYFEIPKSIMHLDTLHDVFLCFFNIFFFHPSY